jgi:hypothetical protein
MNPEETGYYNSLEEYRAAETELHTELMSITRRYISKLGIISLIGILDIVKQETRELERATRKNLDMEKPPQTNVEANEPNFF